MFFLWWPAQRLWARRYRARGWRWSTWGCRTLLSLSGRRWCSTMALSPEEDSLCVSGSSLPKGWGQPQLKLSYTSAQTLTELNFFLRGFIKLTVWSKFWPEDMEGKNEDVNFDDDSNGRLSDFWNIFVHLRREIKRNIRFTTDTHCVQ